MFDFTTAMGTNATEKAIKFLNGTWEISNIHLQRKRKGEIFRSNFGAVEVILKAKESCSEE